MGPCRACTGGKLELRGSLDEGTEVRAPFYCDYGYQIHIGTGTFGNVGLAA
jgi:maltose O-acetyltransferase